MSSSELRRLLVGPHCDDDAARAVHAWVNYYSSSLDEPVEHHQWDAPAAADSDVGLGAAGADVDAGRRATLPPRFTSERMFDLVDCEALLSAVEFGFETWSPTTASSSSLLRAATAQDRYRRRAGERRRRAGRGVRRRVLAPISITAGELLRLGHEKLAAIVYNMLHDRLGGGFWTPRSVATTSPRARSTHDGAAAGEEARRVELSRIHFNTQTCWYSDNSFCFGFHKYAIGLGARHRGARPRPPRHHRRPRAGRRARPRRARVLAPRAHARRWRAETVWNSVEGLGRRAPSSSSSSS